MISANYWSQIFGNTDNRDSVINSERQATAYMYVPYIYMYVPYISLYFSN